MQADVESLSLFIQFLSNRLQSPGAVSNYLSGVKTMHIINGLDTKVFEDYLIKMMIRGLAVEKSHCPKKAAPITTGILRDMYMKMDDTPGDRTYWALFVLAFYLLARKSNLVPDTVAKFDRKKQLTRQDIVITDDGLMVTLKWSKTNQTGRKEVFPLLRNEGSVLCPVTAYERMLEVYPADVKSPVFLIEKYGRIKTVTYRQYQEKIKKLTAAIGLDAGDYTSHSFRRGGATNAFQSGVSASQIKRLGDWQSDAYLEYIDCPIEERMKAGRLIRSRINEEALHESDAD